MNVLAVPGGVNLVVTTPTFYCVLDLTPTEAVDLAQRLIGATRKQVMCQTLTDLVKLVG